MCDGGDGGDYCYGTDCRGSYPGGGCGINFVKEKNVENSELLIETVLYDFRDNYLDNFKIGKKYINYYYHLSKLIDDSPSLLLEIGKNIPILVTAQNRIKENSDEIIIDDNDSNNLITLLDIFASKTEDDFMLFMINDIKSDIDRFKNKNFSKIFDEIE